MQITESHTNKLIKRINSDTFLNKCLDKGISKDTKVLIQSFVDKRVFNNITQKQMSIDCNVSIITIKRFENLKVDSLSLFLNYQFILESLKNKTTLNKPDWVFK